MDSGYSGVWNPADSAGEYNALRFIVQQLIGESNHAALVQVVSCSNSGGVSPVGTVSVTPLLNIIDASGKPIAPGTMYNLPYFRVQGGSNAIILDPEAGDIGMAIFADRDISAVKKSKVVENPASQRRFDLADGMYIGGFLNGSPTQYVQFSASGINIVSPNAIDLSAPDIKLAGSTIELNGSASVEVTAPTFTVNGTTILNGPVSQGSGSGGGNATFGGSITATGNITGNGISLDTHVHSGVATGSSNTGAPV